MLRFPSTTGRIRVVQAAADKFGMGLGRAKAESQGVTPALFRTSTAGKAGGPMFGEHGRTPGARRRAYVTFLALEANALSQ